MCHGSRVRLRSRLCTYPEGANPRTSCWEIAVRGGDQTRASSLRVFQWPHVMQRPAPRRFCCRARQDQLLSAPIFSERACAREEYSRFFHARCKGWRMDQNWMPVMYVHVWTFEAKHFSHGAAAESPIFLPWKNPTLTRFSISSHGY